MEPPYRHLTCKKCGWIHFGVSRAFAIQATNDFNNWAAAQTKETQQQYGWTKTRRVNVTKEYASCDGCGAPNTEARTSTSAELDRIRGSTIGPLVYPEETVI